MHALLENPWHFFKKHYSCDLVYLSVQFFLVCFVVQFFM